MAAKSNEYYKQKYTDKVKTLGAADNYTYNVNDNGMTLIIPLAYTGRTTLTGMGNGDSIIIINKTDGLTYSAIELASLYSGSKDIYGGGITTNGWRSGIYRISVIDGTFYCLNTPPEVDITATKLAVLSGIPSGVSAAEIGYLDGVTSSIQGQIASKADTSNVVKRTYEYVYKFKQIITAASKIISVASINAGLGVSGVFTDAPVVNVYTRSVTSLVESATVTKRIALNAAKTSVSAVVLAGMVSGASYDAAIIFK